MATETEDDKAPVNRRSLHIMSSNSTSAGSQDGFASWFKKHGGKHRLGSQDISMRERGNEQEDGDGVVEGTREYRVYKRRWFGLVQLTLMNIVVSWDVSFYESVLKGGILIRSVAHLCPCRQQSVRVLLRPRVHHQLDQHRLLPRLCLHLPCHHLRPAPQSSDLLHRGSNAHPYRELDPLRGRDVSFRG